MPYIQFRRSSSIPFEAFGDSIFFATKTKFSYPNGYPFLLVYSFFVCIWLIFMDLHLFAGFFTAYFSHNPTNCVVSDVYLKYWYYYSSNCTLNSEIQWKTATKIANHFNDALMSFRPFIYVVRVSISCLLVFVQPANLSWQIILV